MHDPWTDRLSDYLDGDLDAEDRRALEEHLAGCEHCRATLAELRDIVAAARSIENTPPERDLWPAIASALEPRRHHTVTSINARRAPRRFSFTAPQLAAAAVALIALSGTSVWLVARDSAAIEPVSGTIVHAATDGSPNTRLASTTIIPDTAFQTTVAELERTLDQNRAQLDPATVDVLERSIAAIDAAIEESRVALVADPANDTLHRQLENAMQKKIDLLRRANRIRRAGT